jgi:transglutaminase-like putative cysteine protease
MNTDFAVYRPARSRSKAFWSGLLLDRLHRLLVMVVVVQLMQILQEFWWPETYSVVYGVLAVAAVCELAITRHYPVRLAIETAAAIIFSAIYSPWFRWTGWPDKWNSKAEWGQFFEAHIVSLHPFAELAVGSVLLIHFLSWAGKGRNFMIGFLMTAIGIMAVVDSFFPYELWRNIAWMVAAGLGWLVILHLRELRERHPESWNALASRPQLLLLPAVIVIAVLMVSGISMPRAPAFLEDPYTIWSEARGREVPSAGGEGGALGGFMAAPGTVSDQSGYSRDDSNIGGGFNFDYSPVMMVQTNLRTYLRGEAKTVYTGRGWEDRDASDMWTRIPAGGGETNFGIPGRAEDVKTEKVIQTVTMIRQDRIPVMFGAGPITRFADIDSAGRLAVLGNQEEWELRFAPPVRIRSYTVESEVTVLDRAALRQVANPAPGEASIDLRPYLQLPGSLPDRVRELAAKVTSGAENSYDKAVLLETYLKGNYAYNNQPDTSKQTSPDVVDAFLFEIKEGYCDYFSTAFVVMARSIGLPARWVKGYVAGVEEGDISDVFYGGFENNPQGAGTYTVRNADAHSWAEVYFEGYGWIPFEPTAGFSIPQPVAETPVTELETEWTEAAEPQTAASASIAAPDWRYPAGIAALLVLAVAAVYLLRNRRGVTIWNRIRHAGLTPNQRIVREMENLVRFMKKRGLKREAHETLRESFQRWGERNGAFRPDLEKLLSSFERARYSGEAAGEADFREFEAAVASFRSRLKVK